MRAAPGSPGSASALNSVKAGISAGMPVWVCWGVSDPGGRAAAAGPAGAVGVTGRAAGAVQHYGGVIRMSRRETTAARQRNRERIRVALGAVRKTVRTIPREQAREVLIAEFRRQGVDPLPSGASVEVFLDYLALTNPLKRALFATRVLTEAFRPAFSAIRTLDCCLSLRRPLHGVG